MQERLRLVIMASLMASKGRVEGAVEWQVVTASARWCVCVHSLRVRSRGPICPDVPGHGCHVPRLHGACLLSCAPKLQQQNRLEEVCHQEAQLVSVGVAGGRGWVSQVWLGVLLPVRKVINDHEGRNDDHPQLSSQQRTRPCRGRAHMRKGKSLACDLQGFV